MREIFGALKFYGFIDAIPLAFAATVLYTVIRVIYLRAGGHARENVLTEAARALLVWYLVTLVIVVWVPEFPRLMFGKITPSEFAELTFFRGEYANNGRFRNIVRGKFDYFDDAELLANVELFVPFGALLPLAFRRLRWWAVDLIGLGTTLVIELVQPFVGRTCDLDDIAANTLGAVIGCAAAKLFLTIYGLISKKRSKKYE